MGLSRADEIACLCRLASFLEDRRERAQIERMLARRINYMITLCLCGQPCMEHSGELHECEECYARGYGK